ncbi:DUF421 domain-containing protein [Zeaxanthinibacter sp. PT1]|uniref:DUF421 domain-containing protein n=1 Tax=Zeaxanthinibacter TaxID=561554 RepID=UPI002349E54F|nr:YetF domain-containing protein [Zeaxanthinibacter sp. PT1]MDC6352685.1 DUF421 domain-containing protein [Zeaxanthinibacter sp. PT1]
MKDWFAFSWNDALAIVLTATGIYLAVIILTRICGKRSFSKMSSFDFAMTVAIGSIIATTVLSKSVSMYDGVIGLIGVYILQISLSYARRYSWVNALVDNPPLLLMNGSTILYENLKKARVTEADLRSKLREANVIALSEIKAVVFEATGDVSVLHTSDDTPLDDYLLQEVREK